MNPKIEGLRKRAFMLYAGPDGVKLVNREVRKAGIKEEELNDAQLKAVLNNIIKNVFIDYIGLDKTKELLTKDVTHISGYHMNVEEEYHKIHIFERIKFTRWIFVFLVAFIVLVIAWEAYYAQSFNSVQLCEKKKDIQAMDDCYLAIAMSKVNITMCENLSTDLKRFHCYSTLAVKLNDVSSCQKIPLTDVDLIDDRDRCITCVAYNLHNMSLCDKVISQVKQDACVTQLDRKMSLTC